VRLQELSARAYAKAWAGRSPAIIREVTSRTPALEIELLAIRWERIQLIIEARSISPVSPGPLEIALIHPDAEQRVRATRASLTDGRLYARFNVMAGPDQQPLEAGAWTLDARVVRPERGSPDLSQVERTFPIPGLIYRVVPRLDDAAGVLEFEVQIQPDESDDRPARSVRQILRIHRLRRLAFSFVAEVARRSASNSDRRVLFTSRLISEMSGNLEVVHQRMIERGLDHELDIRTMLKPGITTRWSVRDRFRLAYSLVTSAVIVVDDSFLPLRWVQLHPDVRIVQLWHASGAFKTVGYSRIGKPGGPSPYGSSVRYGNRAIVSSEHDVPFYAEAFGMPEANVFPTGIPRMDRYFDEGKRSAGIAAARSAFPEIIGRTTILFAPTYRGDGPKDAFYGYEHIDYAALHALCVERDAVVVIKMHPFVAEPPSIPVPFRDRLLDGSGASIDVNDLLFAVDLLITDYSSIVFEYSVLGRPMLFFAYDLDEYVASRDFYEPFEQFVPGRIVRTFDELLDAIRREDYETAKVAAFAERHFAHLDGGSTDRVIDELILGH
jgi:CDP-ribitol ribitolphosphotransferase / teichoic acid ribitol-phosphate polymerase